MGGRGMSYNKLIKQAQQNVEQTQRENYSGDPVNYKDFLTDPESEIQDEMFKKLKVVKISTRKSTDDVNRESLKQNQKVISLIADDFSFLLEETYQDVQFGSEFTKPGVGGYSSHFHDKNGLLLRFVLDKQALNNPKQNIIATKRLVENNQFSPVPLNESLNTYAAVHEMGHVIENCIFERLIKMNPGNSFYYDTRRVATKIRSDVEKICIERYTKPGQEVIMNISDYSAENSKEWFAETFTNYILSDDEQPVPVALALRDYIRRFE